MVAQFQRNFTKLKWQTDKLFADLARLPSERLSFRPNPDSWSSLDVLDHLRVSEQGILANMRTNLHAGHRVSFDSRFRNAMVLGVMLLPTRVKIPAAARSTAPSRTQLALSAVQAEWEEDRKALTAFLEEVLPADEKLAAFEHPIGGWTTVNGALLFLRSHLLHHCYQLARIQRASKQAATISSVNKTAK